MCEYPAKKKKMPINDEIIKVKVITPELCIVSGCKNNSDFEIELSNNFLSVNLCYNCTTKLIKKLLPLINEEDLEDE